MPQSSDQPPNKLTYQDAGVNIDAGHALVERIKHAVAKTHQPGVLSGLGGFGGLFACPTGYKEPILVSGTDGVGTKLKLAVALNQHQHIGIDLVAMCVNDVLVSGAKPLFFLDYFATSQLDVQHAATVIEGIAAGCEQALCALIGGETAEMPGIYQPKDYDLAGFCVGIVEKSNLLDGRNIKPGDVLIALASSGVHANGFSLIRKCLETDRSALEQPFGGSTLGETLLTPTRIYVKSILPLCEQHQIKGMAHITGGGIIENLPRILPDDVQAVVETDSWQRPAIFDWIQTTGHLDDLEMWRTFNNGVGFILCVDKDIASHCIQRLGASGETAWQIGSIEKRDQQDRPIVMV